MVVRGGSGGVMGLMAARNDVARGKGKGGRGLNLGGLIFVAYDRNRLGGAVA